GDGRRPQRLGPSRPALGSRRAYDGMRDRPPLEAAHGLLFRLEHLENAEELRNRQHLAIALLHVQELQVAASPPGGRIRVRNGAKTTAVDIGHVAEIQDQTNPAGVEEPPHGPDEIRLGLNRQPALRLDEDDAVADAFVDPHDESSLLIDHAQGLPRAAHRLAPCRACSSSKAFAYTRVDANAVACTPLRAASNLITPRIVSAAAQMGGR